MRIAILHPSLSTRGGAENVVVWLAEELGRRGHNTTVFTTDYDDAFYGPRDDLQFEIIEGPFGGYAMKPLRWLAAGWQLRKTLEEYDIVNPHNFPAYVWAYWARVFNRRVPKIVWFAEEPVRAFYRGVIDEHVREALAVDCPGSQTRLAMLKRMRELGLVELFRRAVARVMDRLVVPRLDHIVANSQFVALQIRRIFGIRAEACLLGIPVDRFGLTSDSETNDGNGGDYVLTVSRLFYEKNLFNPIRAVELLVDKGSLPFQKYVIVGTGPLLETLRSFVTEHELDEVVEILGFISEKELTSLYRRASLVLYVPLDETYGLVIPEAGLHRKAVIGPSHGGPSEIVQHGVTGFQVDALDPGQIATTIDRAFKDKGQLTEMGNRNYEFVMNHLTIGAFADRFLRAVQNRTARDRGRGCD